MDKVSDEFPPGTLYATLVDTVPGFLTPNKYVFFVTKSSRRLPLHSLVEMKVHIVGAKDSARGTVLSSDSGMVTVSCARRLAEKTYQLKVNANHNNQVLLEAAEKFIASDKHIHECLYESHRKTAQKDEFITYENIGEILAPEYTHDSIHDNMLFNDRLNKSQQLAVRAATANRPYKILGPPGTGKTETVVEIISQALGAKRTVLVCGPSNVSIDNIIERFQDSKYYAASETPFYRLGSSTKGFAHLNLEQQAAASVQFMEEELRDARDKAKKGSARGKWNKSGNRDGAAVDGGKDSTSAAVRTASVAEELRMLRVDMTTRKRDTAKALRSQSPLVFATLFSSLRENFYFDLCVVDEACQATELECFMAISKARQFILVGDPKQLCPDCPSLYENVTLPTVLLNEQYRMPSELISFSNEHFYGNKIISPRLDDFLFFGHHKILFIDTSYSCCSFSETGSGTSKLNIQEARLVLETVEWLLGQAGCHGVRPSMTSIGVISPYSAHVEYIRELLSQSEGGHSSTHVRLAGAASQPVTVDTVDGFQGQERDFVILSMVRSNAAQQYGFLSNQKRMNVAMTRCRRGLIIIGDSSTFGKDAFFSKLFRFLDKSAYVIDPESFRSMLGLDT